MKTYAVTGGAGFIGSTLIEKLLLEGNKVINIDNFNDYYSLEIKVLNVLESCNLESEIKNEILKKLLLEGDKDLILKELKRIVNKKNYILETIDIRDKKELKRVFSENKIDCIINLAAMAGVRPSLEDPMLYMDVNINGLMNLLECSKNNGINKFIQASSSSVYGNNKKVPFSELDRVDHSISPYAATKKSGEVLGHTYYHLYNIDMIQLRFFTVYGPRQRPDLAIHKFTKMIINNEAIPFYGDGSTQRDYTYIDDIIDGVYKAIQYVENNENIYEIINLGESETISLKRMVSTIEKSLGKEAKINKMPMQPGDVEKTNADITKAKDLIKYEPKTNFESGIDKFVKWYKKREETRL